MVYSTQFLRNHPKIRAWAISIWLQSAIEKYQFMCAVSLRALVSLNARRKSWHTFSSFISMNRCQSSLSWTILIPLCLAGLNVSSQKRRFQRPPLPKKKKATTTTTTTTTTQSALWLASFEIKKYWPILHWLAYLAIRLVFSSAIYQSLFIFAYNIVSWIAENLPKRAWLFGER